jgi:hypothetical protein
MAGSVIQQNYMNGLRRFITSGNCAAFNYHFAKRCVVEGNRLNVYLQVFDSETLGDNLQKRIFTALNMFSRVQVEQICQCSECSNLHSPYMYLWQLSHYAKQHPTASTRNGLNNVNKLGCAQLRMRFVAVINQQLEISTVTINNNQSIKQQTE